MAEVPEPKWQADPQIDTSLDWLFRDGSDTPKDPLAGSDFFVAPPPAEPAPVTPRPAAPPRPAATPGPAPEPGPPPPSLTLVVAAAALAVVVLALAGFLVYRFVQTPAGETAAPDPGVTAEAPDPAGEGEAPPPAVEPEPTPTPSSTASPQELLDRQADADSRYVTSTLYLKWSPVIAAVKATDADSFQLIWASYQNYKARYPNLVVIHGDAWSNFKLSHEYYLFNAGEAYETADEALEWCRAADRWRNDLCYATRVGGEPGQSSKYIPLEETSETPADSPAPS
jgi:hypothetical protein